MADGGGMRFNKGKVPIDLVPTSLIFETAKVLGKGAEKYAPRNWQRGMSWNTVYGCLMRHILKWASPFHSDLDDETGLSHLSHAACNIAMLIEYSRTCPELDDRFKYEENNDIEYVEEHELDDHAAEFNDDMTYITK